MGIIDYFRNLSSSRRKAKQDRIRDAEAKACTYICKGLISREDLRKRYDELREKLYSS